MQCPLTGAIVSRPQRYQSLVPMEMAMVVVDKSSKSPVDIEAKPGIVGSRYYVDKRIGEGSFGVIYKGNLFNRVCTIYLFTNVNCRCGM